MIKQVRLYISGDVIGVGFRAWTKIQSKHFRVKGWVKNVFDKSHLFGPSGGVEVLLQGEEEMLSQMVERLRSGPAIAHVAHVDVMVEPVGERYDSFEIRK